MVVNFRCFVQVDKNGGLYFLYFYCFSQYFSTFIVSGKTGVGSAGEQPARDSLITFELKYMSPALRRGHFNLMVLCLQKLSYKLLFPNLR